MKLIAVNQTTLTNLKERAIERTDVTFWHGLSATKHPLGVYDCGGRDHSWANEFNVTSGKTYTVRVIAKQTKGSIRLAGGIWYTAMTSGHAYDSYAPFTLVGETSEDGLGIYERNLVVASGKTKAKIYIQLEQPYSGGSTAYRIYDAQVFDENGHPLVTDQNNFGALTSPMAAPDGTYIWKRTITYYTDGTNSTVWEYSGVGSKGADGTNGQTSHVHFAFADNATGGGFSLTTPKAYMGWYADFNETASNDPTKYKWTKVEGPKGAPGGKGDDGKTSYLHLAYASSADGKTGFSFTDTKQQYQGYYTDFTQSSSTDPTKYTWMDRRAGVEVGGVNLLHNSKGPFKPNKDNPYKHDNYIVYPKVTAYLEEGKQYIVTAKTDGVFSNNHVNVESDNIILWMVKQNGSVNQIISDTKTGEVGTVFVWNHPTGEYCLRVNAYHDEPDKSAWEVKIEEGNVKTTYTRNPEDVQSDIDSKADQALTQQQLEALEAKRQQMIVEIEAKATIEQISELQGYLNKVKQDDEVGRQKIAATATAIEERVRNIEPILTYSQKMQFIDTYITQGNGGMIIGANDSTTKVVVTPNRISFQDGGSEVAYISQSVLHIDNGVFTLSLQLGHFITRAHPKNQYVNGTYFVK